VHLLRERFRQLGKLLQYEFMFAADTELDDIFDDGIESMLAAGEIERMADHVRVADARAGRAVEEYATMLRTYFESYLLAMRGVSLLLDGPLPRKEWLKRTLAHGQRMYLSGELGLRESLSKPKLESAIKTLKEHGLLDIGPQDVLQIGEGVGAASDLRELEKKLTAFIR
jgi:glycerol-3-phosphate O-acyltransferase